MPLAIVVRPLDELACAQVGGIYSPAEPARLEMILGQTDVMTKLEYFEGRRATGVFAYLGRGRRAMRVGRILVAAR